MKNSSHTKFLTLTLLEDVDLRGCLLTLDALHATRDTARTIVETHGADYVLAVKANCPDSFAQLAAVDWDGDGARRPARPRPIPSVKSPCRDSGRRCWR